MTKARILIVDDDPGIRRLLQHQVESIGFTVCGLATNGEQACRQAAESRPDLVLMDIVLPGPLDGIRAADQIRREANIPVVFVTGHADPSVLEQVWPASPYGFLLKPFDREMLQMTLTTALARRSAEQELIALHGLHSLIVSRVDVGIILYDRELRFLLWNPFMEQITGVPAADVLGQCAVDLFPHLRREGLDTLLQRALAGESLSSHDFPYNIPSTGRRGWAWASYAPHRNTEGIVVGVIAVVREITQRKEAELEVLRLNEHLTDLVAQRTTALNKANLHLRREMRARQRLSMLMERGMERQQHRIGQDLHDSLGQVLAAVALKSQVLQTLLSTGSKTAELAGDIIRLANDASVRIRDIAHLLSPLALAGENLVAKLEELAAYATAHMGLECRVQCDPPAVAGLDETKAAILYRIAQEAVTNAAKHGRARNVTVLLSRQRAHVLLTIRDNGIGIRGRKPMSSPGMGLKAMSYRASLVGGTLRILRPPDGGTMIACRIPCGRRKRPRR